MILTIRNDRLPHRYLRPGTTIRQRNRVQCQKSFDGFPKTQFYDFYIQLARISKQIRKLQDFRVEGEAFIQLENGVSRQTGCLWLYNVDKLDWESEQNLEARLKELQREIRKLTQRFKQGYRVTFKLHQWFDSVEKSGHWDNYTSEASLPCNVSPLTHINIRTSSKKLSLGTSL